MREGLNQTSSSAKRRARTRSLIQLGSLLDLAGTLDVFDIPLGVDLQRDTSVKNNIAALFKGLLELNELTKSSDVDLKLWALQGLEAFKSRGLSETRPLDRKKEEGLSQSSANSNGALSFINTTQA